MKPGEAQALLTRLDKRSGEEGKAEAERHNSEFDAAMKAMNNVVKVGNTTNELLVKLLRKPTL